MSDNGSTRRGFLRALGVGAAALAGVRSSDLGACSLGPLTAEAPLPNFVFILADDLGYQDL